MRSPLRADPSASLPERVSRLEENIEILSGAIEFQAEARREGDRELRGEIRALAEAVSGRHDELRQLIDESTAPARTEWLGFGFSCSMEPLRRPLRLRRRWWGGNAMLKPGRTRVDPENLPPGAPPETVWQGVAWLDADGNATDDESKVASIIVDLRTDDGTPVLTVYGTPPGDAAPGS
jgi:hypothetical protein